MRIPPHSTAAEAAYRRPTPAPPPANDERSSLRTRRQTLPAPPPSSPPVPTLGPASPLAESPPPTPEAVTQEGFTKAWGSNDEAYDINGDGTVDVQDLIQFILGSPQEASAPQGEQGGQNGEAETAGNRKTELNRVADKIVDRLAATDFNAPPERVASHVRSLSLDAEGQNQVLSKVLRQYPPGRVLSVYG